MAVTINQIQRALEQTGGFQSRAAKKLRITDSALCQRIKKSKLLQTLLYMIKESNLDLAEDELIKKIKKGNLGAICFYLKCQGKKRGYIERQEIDDVTINRQPFVLKGLNINEVD